MRSYSAYASTCGCSHSTSSRGATRHPPRHADTYIRLYHAELLPLRLDTRMLNTRLHTRQPSLLAFQPPRITPGTPPYHHVCFTRRGSSSSALWAATRPAAESLLVRNVSLGHTPDL